MKKLKKLMHELKRFRWDYFISAADIGYRQAKVAYKIMHEVKWDPKNNYFVFESTAVMDKRSVKARAEEETKIAAEQKKKDECTCQNCMLRRKIEKDNQPVMH